MRIVLFLWQLPQIIISLLLYLYYDITHKVIECVEDTEDNFVIRVNSSSNVSFGPIIFVSKNASINTINHEKGHSKQSLFLGPLYLFVIGIPSSIHLLIWKMFNKKWNYYKFYTERWAEKLKPTK